MSRLSRAVAQQTSKQHGRALTGIYRRMQGAFAVVTVQGADVTLPFAGTVQPVPGAVVNIELRDSGYLVLGPVKSPPTRGRITATGTPFVTVLAGGESFELPYMAAYTPAVDDDVAIDWSEAGGLVRGKVSTTPVAAPVSPVFEALPGHYHPSPFLATAAGYHRLSGGAPNLSWFPNYGIGQASAAWYGSTVADSIPDGATIVSARLFLSVRSSQLGGPKLQVIEGAGPQARVQVGGDFPLPARTGWVPIPLEVIDLLKVAPRGLSTIGATVPSGSDIYKKLTDDPMSFALDIEWRS
ncbi:hypothetical protein [Agrococcus sp. Marseille-Q4369]|uniref:hypothetical protein n=1 Tax=Agrococcus sp. Marseille-Q4369 TaxID=2810513 RepID=UPI001B8AFEA3|nr:hypothetical protein [Agrococcus sp. Marseille-Q4369]QUW18900.1 hypothetical protein JSQ78_00500 [Agrococcus sp. Marseille-Q4369]